MARAALSPEQEEIERRHRKTTVQASILATLGSTIAIATTIAPVIAWFARPAIVATMAEAMAPAVNAQVKSQTTPLGEGLKALLRGRIAQLEDEIAQLERVDRQRGLDEIDTQRLTSKRRELRDQQMALNAITTAQQPSLIP